MTCSNCGTENKPERKFCRACGTALAAGCPACGAANEPDDAFCGTCGTAIAPAPRPAIGVRPSAPASPAPIAERRVVSILFADLVGFTALAADRDPEETRELLSRYFDLARDVIGRYGGTVEKFIGDAVMAVWGAPTAREDDAERAVRAALEVVDAVPTLGSGIQARAGVLTGEAAVTIGATNQGMVAGEIVNTASRLQSVAQPGTVLVGEATQRAASRAVVFEAAGEQNLKGKVAPVPAWQALRVVAEIGGRNRADTLEAPFVGRADELRMLKDLFHATERERRARLVSVIGPAGIGKTRLAWEFLKYIDGLVDTVWWHDGRSPAYGEGITFWALGEMVRGRAGLLETDDEPTTRAKVAEVLATHVPEPDERRWIEPAILALLGIEAGTTGADELFGAWRTLFERFAVTAPVVMVFEDFHFADSGLIDFVDHLLEWSRNVPIYVVTLARPELIERRPNWGAGKRNFTSIYLEPLPEGAMREMLHGLVPGLPETALQAIVDRADGIPLYAVETVRMLVGEGRLALDAGVYRPVRDLTNLAVPETLTALIASRLDRLSAEERALVSDAAVLGQSFTTAGLSAVSGVPQIELEPRLRALARQELLKLETDPRSPERGQYAFVQALIREVAYNTLAKRDRKNRHLAAARFFESLGSDELAAALASHYLAAHQNATEGPEADALAGQARITLSAAASRAAALGSHEQAVAFLRQALTVATDPADQAALLERAGDSSSAAARHDDAEGLLHRAIAVHRERDDRVGAARATAALASAVLETFHIDAALALLLPAVEEFADMAGQPAYVAMIGQLARTYFLGGETTQAIVWTDRTLPAAERLNAVEIVADTLVTKGCALSNGGRAYEGLGVIKAGLELAEANGLSRTALRARGNLGAFQSNLEGPVVALASQRDALAEARRLGLRGYAVWMVQNTSGAALLTGDWDWALGELDALLATDLELGDRIPLAAGAIGLRLLRGDATAPALAAFEVLMDGVTEANLQQTRVEIQAWIALVEGRHTAARAHFHALAEMSPLNAPAGYALAGLAALLDDDLAGARDDLDGLDGLGVHGPLVTARRTALQAGIAALEGRTTDSLQRYRDALHRFGQLGDVLEAALTQITMASVLGADEPEVRAAVDSARGTLARLGSVPMLARLDAVLANPPRRSSGAVLRSVERTLT